MKIKNFKPKFVIIALGLILLVILAFLGVRYRNLKYGILSTDYPGVKTIDLDDYPTLLLEDEEQQDNTEKPSEQPEETK